MATITGFTAARMLEIENTTIVDGEVTGDNLTLITREGTEIDAGNVRGIQGVAGLMAGVLPGEVKMWPGDTLPDDMVYGTWVWADGASYAIADHPIAAGHIADEWRTFGGHSDPGGANFRVPDLRGLTPAGMDSMPGGSGANRVVRTEADDLAGRSGVETHVLTEAELAAHDHGSVSISGTTGAAGGHNHSDNGVVAGSSWGGGTGFTTAFGSPMLTASVGDHTHSFSGSGGTSDAGGDDAHENMQPTVFVPYIVCLDG